MKIGSPFPYGKRDYLEENSDWVSIISVMPSYNK